MGHLAHLKSLPGAINEFHLLEGLKLLFSITLDQLSTALSLLGNAGEMPLNQHGFTWCLHCADGAKGGWRVSQETTACLGKIFSHTRQSTSPIPFFLAVLESEFQYLQQVIVP